MEYKRISRALFTFVKLKWNTNRENCKPYETLRQFLSIIAPVPAGTFFGGDGKDYYPAGQLDILEPEIARAHFLAGIRNYGAGLDVVYTENTNNTDSGWCCR